TSLEKVTKLEIIRYDSKSRKRELVAEVDTAKVTYGLSQSAIKASGQIQDEGKSNLAVSYSSNTDGYYKTYTCVATGLTRDGKEMSIFNSKKVKGSALVSSQPPNSEKCCQSAEAVQAQAETIKSLEEAVQNISAAIADVENKGLELNELHEQVRNISTLEEDVQNNKVTLEGILPKISLTYQKLMKTIRYYARRSFGFEWYLAIDRLQYDVSSIYNGKAYFASKSPGNFPFDQMEQMCATFHGHLVEFDYHGEQMRVEMFLKTIGDYEYYTGANDQDNEGTFVYYASKRPVTGVRWMTGSPISGGEDEDCVQIKENGLVNVRCDRPSRFVCELQVLPNPAK
ncbi:mannose-binding protein c, partial [Plakobranchus ocellatus]